VAICGGLASQRVSESASQRGTQIFARGFGPLVAESASEMRREQGAWRGYGVGLRGIRAFPRPKGGMWGTHVRAH